MSFGRVFVSRAWRRFALLAWVATWLAAWTPAGAGVPLGAGMAAGSADFCAVRPAGKATEPAPAAPRDAASPHCAWCTGLSAAALPGPAAPLLPPRADAGLAAPAAPFLAATVRDSLRIAHPRAPPTRG